MGERGIINDIIESGRKGWHFDWLCLCLVMVYSFYTLQLCCSVHMVHKGPWLIHPPSHRVSNNYDTQVGSPRQKHMTHAGPILSQTFIAATGKNTLCLQIRQIKSGKGDSKFWECMVTGEFEVQDQVMFPEHWIQLYVTVNHTQFCES